MFAVLRRQSACRCSAGSAGSKRQRSTPLPPLSHILRRSSLHSGLPEVVVPSEWLARKPRPRLDDEFDPTRIEKGWYKYWDSRGLFGPRQPAHGDSRPAVRMLLPPPNVTGELHIGHALMVAVGDALARYYRMRGHSVVWLPGTDHAGIATQVVVERTLAANSVRERTGLRAPRHRLGREAFLAKVDEWRAEYGTRILRQLRRLGASTTNTREYYTRDPELSTAVTNAFVRLWEDGLIYRDDRMVNWSPALQSAVSDIEVEFKEIKHGPGSEKGLKIEGARFGQMHHIAYPVVDGSEGEEIVVCTTRPETIPGDRAVAVHPDDPRYRHLHYQLVRHPLIPGLAIPVVPDAELVNPALGTGAVKITPAHDPADFAFWKRHSRQAAVGDEGGGEGEGSPRRVDIPMVAVFDAAGKMTPDCQIEHFVGTDRLHVRRKTVVMLEEAGVYRGSEVHDMRVPVCSRTGAVIEQTPRAQWYLRTQPLVQKVRAAAERDGLVFVPESPAAQLWDGWLDGIQDWCLSRQIWWGHRIPAYRVVGRDGQPTPRWIAAESEAHARQQLTDAEARAGCTLAQDDDVLDTWFSSALLPLSTAGWRGLKPADPSSPSSPSSADSSAEPAGSDESWRENYPLTFIESGSDILFFWLARMAMLCTHFSGRLPFPEAILHPLVCDAIGKKMSKSAGNVLDPLDIIAGRTCEQLVTAFKKSQPMPTRRKEKSAEGRARHLERELRLNLPSGDIVKSGADALRMALLDYTRQQRQISFEVRAVDPFRKLAIKMHNAVLFYARAVATEPFTLVDLATAPLTPRDRYLLHHTRKLIVTVDAALQSRQLYEATNALREFIYDVLCGVYLEFAKADISPLAEGAEGFEDAEGIEGIAEDFVEGAWGVEDAEGVVGGAESASRTAIRTQQQRDMAMTLLYTVYDVVLRLLHPFMPFHSEALWQELDPATRALVDGATIVTAPWPDAAVDLPAPADGMDDAGGDEMAKALELLAELRAWKGLRGVVVPPSGPTGEFIRAQWPTLERLSRVRGRLRLAKRTELFREATWIWEGEV